jgi:uncharacterized protein with beta-barrel porin domain
LNTGTAPLRSLNYTGRQLINALQQVSGEEVAAQGTLATQVPAGQFSNIGSRLNALRYGTAAAALRGRASALNWSPSGVDDSFHLAGDNPGAGYFTRDGGGAQFLHTAFNSAGDTQPSAPTARNSNPAVSNPWGVFVEGAYNYGTRDQTAGEDGFDFKARSVTAGVDYNFGSAVAGVSVGYDSYKSDFVTNGTSISGGNARVKGTSGSLFAAWFGERWSLNGIVSYGSLKTDISRVAIYTPAPGPSCTPVCGVSEKRSYLGNPDGRDTAVGITAGYDLSAGPWNLSPTVSLNYRKVKIDAYRESEFNPAGTPAGLALRYDSQDIDSMRSVLGISASRPYSRSFGVVSPNFKLEWQHEYKNKSRAVNAAYVIDDSPTNVSRFAIATDAAAKDFGIAGIGVTALFSNRLQAYLTYERLIGVSYLTSNTFTFGVRGQL